jgi:hypothetical protein
LLAILRNFLFKDLNSFYAADWAPELHQSASSEEHRMSIVIPLLTPTQRADLPERAREIIEYRKSGLSLNHIQGCPLDCVH